MHEDAPAKVSFIYTDVDMFHADTCPRQYQIRNPWRRDGSLWMNINSSPLQSVITTRQFDCSDTLRSPKFRALRMGKVFGGRGAGISIVYIHRREGDSAEHERSVNDVDIS